MSGSNQQDRTRRGADSGSVPISWLENDCSRPIGYFSHVRLIVAISNE